MMASEINDIQLFEKISKHLIETNRPLYIIIDGMSGSGKSFLGRHIQKLFLGNLFFMDDFFLRSEQRTKERLEEVGGNVDYERFYEEVLSNLLVQDIFYYTKFDCSTMTLREKVLVNAHQINIIEGSYSHHPYFNTAFHEMKKKGKLILIALKTDSNIQKSRILARNGEIMLPRFVKEWIPKENSYFEKYEIFSNCDYIMYT